MTSIPCDIVLLPEPALADQTIAASRKLQSLGALYQLEPGKVYSHASLYMCQLKVEDLAQAQDLLADLAATMSAISAKATRYFQEEHYFDIEYEKSPAMIQFQTAVLAAINPIRDGLRAKDQARLASTTGAAHDNLVTYGYRSIGELFRPHISLTRFTEDQPNATHELPPVSTFNGTFNQLGLFEMGDNGTCVRHIASFKLR